METTALLQLRLLHRMLRVGELLALVAFLSWSSWHVPSAVNAALRLAGSLLLNARFVFLLGNAIVLLLFALSRHERDLSPSSLLSTSDEQQQQPPAATQQQAAAFVPPAGASSGLFPSFATPPPPTLPSSRDAVTGTATTTSFATPAAAPPPLATVDVALRREATATAIPSFEDDKKRVTKARAPWREATAVPSFEEDKKRVSKARAPRRSRSDKLMMLAGPARRAASPELRRCESEKSGRRRRSSVTARDAEACCWGREDADEFRRQVEAFIARQTRFHRQESLTTLAEAAPGALAVVEY